MPSIPWARLPEQVNADGEFRLAARFWDACVRLDFGGESRALRFEGGRLVEVRPCGQDAACDLWVSASAEDWEKLLEPVPRPFYQDLVGAQLHHGFRMNENPLAWAAYYPALRRLVEILRAAREDA